MALLGSSVLSNGKARHSAASQCNGMAQKSTAMAKHGLAMQRQSGSNRGDAMAKRRAEEHSNGGAQQTEQWQRTAAYRAATESFAVNVNNHN